MKINEILEIKQIYLCHNNNNKIEGKQLICMVQKSTDEQQQKTGSQLCQMHFGHSSEVLKRTKTAKKMLQIAYLNQWIRTMYQCGGHEKIQLHFVGMLQLVAYRH